MKKVFKVFVVIIGIFVLLIGIAMGSMAYLRSSNNAYKGDYISTMASKSSSAGKALIVYQPSAKSTSADIADQIAKGLNEAGFEVTLSYPGKHLSPDVKDYSVLVFGSPVFMEQPSTALTDYIKNLQNSGDKKIAIYSVGSLEKNNELDLIAKNFKSEKISQKTKFTGSDKANLDKAYEFGADLGKE